MSHDLERGRIEFKKIYGVDYFIPDEDPPVVNVLQALLLQPDSVIVEYGAGQGHFTLPIAEALEKERGSGLVFSFEFSEQLIERLDEAALLLELTNRIQTFPLAILEDPSVLPIQDESVDRMLIVNSAQHFRDPLPLCRETARILRTGGFVLLANWINKDGNLDEPSHSLSAEPDKVISCLCDVGLGAHTRLTLDGYSWVVRATKRLSTS